MRYWAPKLHLSPAQPRGSIIQNLFKMGGPSGLRTLLGIMTHNSSKLARRPDLESSVIRR